MPLAVPREVAPPGTVAQLEPLAGQLEQQVRDLAAWLTTARPADVPGCLPLLEQTLEAVRALAGRPAEAGGAELSHRLEALRGGLARLRLLFDQGAHLLGERAELLRQAGRYDAAGALLPEPPAAAQSWEC